MSPEAGALARAIREADARIRAREAESFDEDAPQTMSPDRMDELNDADLEVIRVAAMSLVGLLEA